MMTKWIAALAAVSLATAPAAAQVNRTATPADETESLGGNGALWLAALGMVIAAAFILTEDDDDDLPVSP